MNTSSLVQKVWNFCHTLRDDGVGYGDYLEQLTKCHRGQRHLTLMNSGIHAAPFGPNSFILTPSWTWLSQAKSKPARVKPQRSPELTRPLLKE